MYLRSVESQVPGHNLQLRRVGSHFLKYKFLLRRMETKVLGDNLHLRRVENQVLGHNCQFRRVECQVLGKNGIPKSSKVRFFDISCSLEVPENQFAAQKRKMQVCISEWSTIRLERVVVVDNV